MLAAAERVLRAEGLAGLSLRAVAREAGTAPNAVYTYVPTMAALRNDLADAFLARLDLDLLLPEGSRGPDQPVGAGGPPEDPRETLRRFLQHVLEHFEGSPRLVELLAGQRVVGAGALALHEALLTFFENRLGWDLARAADATLFLTEWVHGHLVLGPSNAQPLDPDVARRADLSAHPRSAAALQLPAGAALGLPLRALFGDPAV
ncbi:regulatory protein, tetR family [Auraticoccus monumenti]|uniref:Regulatory protein, tetR family n=1 Tax=Auraticoccus monumenti TaxID=675864 RepID=A0A1G6TYA6_9ACTN|nr:regulatory protein, tetR family [Auraticoccus monumenti]